MNDNYPPGVTAADFIEPPDPPWLKAYEDFGCELPETYDLDDAIANIKAKGLELEDLEAELERYR